MSTMRPRPTKPGPGAHLGCVDERSAGDGEVVAPERPQGERSGAEETRVPGFAPGRLWDPPGSGTSLLSWVTSGHTGDAALPDDAPKDPDAVAFAPGALTGILTHHTAGTPSTDAHRTELVVRSLDRHVHGAWGRLSGSSSDHGPRLGLVATLSAVGLLVAAVLFVLQRASSVALTVVVAAACMLATTGAYVALELEALGVSPELGSWLLWVASELVVASTGWVVASRHQGSISVQRAEWLRPCLRSGLLALSAVWAIGGVVRNVWWWSPAIAGTASVAAAAANVAVDAEGQFNFPDSMDLGFYAFGLLGALAIVGLVVLAQFVSVARAPTRT